MDYVEIAKWSQIISSALFLCVMLYLWVKFVQPAIETVQQNRNKQIAEAERHRDEAKAAVESLNGGIEDAQRDADLIRLRAEEQGQLEADAIVEESRQAGERALRNAQGELERARAAAREQLRDEFAERALALARQDAEQKVDGNINARLVQRFVESLEHGGRN